VGNEDAREAALPWKTRNLRAGQQVNDGIVPNSSAPRLDRLWWLPAGQGIWYLLPSQYWQDDGTKANDYSISCKLSARPSYHTSFSGAVPEEHVCFHLLDGRN
jgi:hypothetical protein